MSETDLDTYALKAAAAAEVAGARPALPAADAARLPAAHRAGRRRRHRGGASRRLPRGRLRRGGDLQPHARAGRGAARRVLPRRRGDRRHRPHARPRRHRGRRHHAAPGRAPADDRGGARAPASTCCRKSPSWSTSTPAARLCDLADAQGVRLAVNQNGRWAPHLAWMREAVRAGLIGQVQALDIAIHWDHGWIAGTAFDGIDDLILYDFAVHWFDFLASLGVRPTSVYAARARAAGQTVAPAAARPGASSPSTAARRRSPSTARRGSAPRTAPSSAAAPARWSATARTSAIRR